MKRNGAKINRIIASIACLTAALALAVFSCFAWFVKNQQVSSGISATLSDGNITDLSVHYYSLTGKTDTDNEDGSTTTTYTVYQDLGEEDGSTGIAIGAYGSTGSTATLIKVTYTVKNDNATKIIFAGSGTATFPAEAKTNEEGDTYYSTTMSSAVSLRLTDSYGYTITPNYDKTGSLNSSEPSSISTSKTTATFCDVSALSGSSIDEENIVFSDITGTQNESDGYYYVTRYIVMEYSEDNVLALYPSSGGSFSTPLSCSGDITLAVKDNNASDDVSGGTSDSGDSEDSSDSGGETEATEHSYEFSISELQTAISERTTLEDGVALVASDFKTGSNSFLTLLEESSNNKYRTNNNGVFEIKGKGLSVTFKGTGTIDITIASTGTTNVSSLALIDEDGYYVTGKIPETATTAEAVETNLGYYYNVTGSSTYVTITFTVSSAGDYIIATNIDTTQNRGARFSAIEMSDTY